MLTKAGHKYLDALLLKSKLFDNSESIFRNILVIILSYCLILHQGLKVNENLNAQLPAGHNNEMVDLLLQSPQQLPLA